MVLQVTNSPFSQEQTELLNRLLPSLTQMQRMWLSGYLSADVANVETLAPLTAAPMEALSISAPAASREITVLYGSQTGNCRKLAKKLVDLLQERGFRAAQSSMLDFKTNTLKKVQTLLVIVSTHGEGEPPDDALSFYEFLHSKRAPQLDGLPFSVLALGDTSYEFFCQAGKDFDKRLAELGGKRLAPRVDCDADFEEAAAEWMRQVLAALGGPSANPAPVKAGGTTAAGTVQTVYSKANPFPAAVLENLNLNGRGSDKITRHLELSLEGANLQYEPGDCLGIYPENHPGLVEDLMQAMGWNPEEAVPLGKNGAIGSLRDALLRHYEITVATKPLLEQIAKLSANKKLKELLSAGREEELRSYLRDRDLLDLAQDFGLRGIPAKEFVTVLRKLPARLYSISSSPLAYPDEVHLTIRAVAYEAHGRRRYGVCSTYVAERVQIGDTLPVYVHQNPNFRLPQNLDTPIIMIGPGTGVAPFRAFLGEREELGAKGKTWLFFGDRHFSTDFLYQTEWQRWLKEGVLTRMDVAFSRDTEQKVYVQHRMLEKSRELFQWLEDGAHLYVCGDEKKMAHDVHATLVDVLGKEGGLTAEQAAEYLATMQREKRYQRDVY
ncbi:MAG TPA: assimilatory sulfite reductase (NADPH) flavoprotein subunit [Bacilli bacterium]